MLSTVVPLEDELGDVLDKALRRAGLAVDEAALRAGISATRLRDAIDYRSTLDNADIRRLAEVLGLNEVGLCALGAERYPLPAMGPLPFQIFPLRIRHGIGFANAYAVAVPGEPSGLLFDAGPSLEALKAVWPSEITQVVGLFLTHIESEHTGELCAVVEHYNIPSAFVPVGVQPPCGQPMAEGEVRRAGAFRVMAFSTPGHSAAHNCYLVALAGVRSGPSVLISGDMIFAGSAGGGYFCPKTLHANLRRVLEILPPDTVIAPGHGPLTTVENELRFNPFL